MLAFYSACCRAIDQQHALNHGLHWHASLQEYVAACVETQQQQEKELGKLKAEKKDIEKVISSNKKQLAVQSAAQHMVPRQHSFPSYLCWAPALSSASACVVALLFRLEAGPTA